MRVVVGGALAVDEQEQWVGRVVGRLDLRDGRLVPCGGVAYAVPDGTVIDLDHSRKRKTRRREGEHRYRGTVEGGVWQVAESFPRVDAAPLREALAQAEAMESGRRLVARDCVIVSGLHGSPRRPAAPAVATAWPCPARR